MQLDAGVELVGVSLFGPPPLKDVHLRLDDGVTALYGLNGAGKSRLLSGVKDALLGITRPDRRSWLHFRLSFESPSFADFESDDTRPPSAIYDSIVSALQASHKSALGEILATYLFEPNLNKAIEAFHVEHNGSKLPSDRQELTARQMQLRLGSGWEGLDHEEVTSEFSHSDRLVMEPSGSEDAPAWHMFASAEFYDLAWEYLIPMRYHYKRKQAIAENGTPDDDGILSQLTQESLLWYVATGCVDEDPERAWAMPDWLSLPGPFVGEYRGNFATVFDQAGLSDATLTDQTIDILSHTGEAWIEAFMDGELVLSESVTVALKELERRATYFAQAILPTIPPLRFNLGMPTQWLKSEGAQWVAEGDDEGDVFSLHDLSDAQERWARLAVARALQGAETSIVLLDEPERGLHPRALHELPLALYRHFGSRGAAVVVATHSPSFLDQETVRPLHVSRDFIGSTTVKDVEASAADKGARTELVDRLGLRPSDLLSLMSTAVLLEGMHDEIVLSGLLPETFSRTDVRSFRLGGAKNAVSILDSQFLLEASSASIVVVLDNDGRGEFLRRWSRMKEAVDSNSFEKARQIAQSLAETGGGEAKWLQSLALDAIEQGLTHRVSVIGLREPDIICYLDFTDLLPGFTTWSDLVPRWQRESGRDLKGWLFKEFGWRISIRLLKRAIAARPKDSVIDQDLVSLSTFLRASGRNVGL